jgi:transcription elongation factor Elf1
MIDINNIKPIEDEGYKWDYNSNIICPYCGHENEPDSECDNENFEEAHETYCYECGKHFMVTPRIEIDYSSEPIENYYISEVKRLNKQIKWYEDKVNNEETYSNDDDYYNMILKHYKSELEKLNRTFEKYFEDNEESI